MADTKSTLALTLAQGDLERIIAETIKAQVAAAFAAKGGDLAGGVIDRLLTEKVDQHGQPCHYSKTTMIEHLCYGQLRTMVRDAVSQWVKDNEEEIRKAVIGALNRNKKQVADGLLTSLVAAAGSQYRFDVHLAASIPKE